MKILLANLVKLFLVQDALIPQTVCLGVELSLEMAGEKHLYLTGILLAVIEGKELQ